VKKVKITILSSFLALLLSFCYSYMSPAKEISISKCRKNDAEVSKNLARYRFEYNFIGPSK